MALSKLTKLLDESRVNYSRILHSPAYTSQQTAESAHIPGKNLAKTVIVKLDGNFAMIVLPANHRIDLQWLKESIHCNSVELAREYEFSKQFPECETGAMPPFGNLFGMDVFVSRELALDEEIAFNAGSHDELIRMAYKDWARLVKPKIIKIH